MVLVFWRIQKAQWIERIAPSAPLEIPVQAPVAKHSVLAGRAKPRYEAL